MNQDTDANIMMGSAPPTPLRLCDESGLAHLELSGGNGLSIRVLPNGCLYAIQCGEILVNQLLGSPLAGGVHRIYLRVHDRGSVHFEEIVGPSARGDLTHSADRITWSGESKSIAYRCTCWLHPSGEFWFFKLDVRNESAEPICCDAVLVQDVALATRGQARNNELYTSQYLDHFVANHDDAGHVLMTRQNLAQSVKSDERDEQIELHPWLMQGCFPRAAGFVTDGFDLFGAGHRADGVPAALSREVIGDRVRQYETAFTGIQSNKLKLEPGKGQSWTFFAHFVEDHPAASGTADLARLALVQAAQEDLDEALASRIPTRACPRERSILQACEAFVADEFDSHDVDEHFPGERRHIELIDGRLASFFRSDDSKHLVMKAKELSVARPHGHILRSGVGFRPNAELLSCTCYAAGVFASQIALGNTSIAKLLSCMRDPLNIVRSNGLRILVRESPSGPWQLLTVPSAFEMALDGCRWFYKRGERMLVISCSASTVDPVLRFDVRSKGPPLEFLIFGEIAAAPSEYDFAAQLWVDQASKRITVRPGSLSPLAKSQPDISFHVVTNTPDEIAAIGDSGLLFADGKSRGYPYFVIQSRPTRAIGIAFIGTFADSARAEGLCTKYESEQSNGDDSAIFWDSLTAQTRVSSSSSRQVEQIQDTLSWFAHDALIHLSTPRGLEQANGGAWGVRDVCQGPVEFLLSYDRADLVADILRTLFARQYHDRCDWPQWFSFPPFHEHQSDHSHGDVLIWPLKALCDYLAHTDDGSILRERLAYTSEETFEASDRVESVLEHVDRLLVRIRQEFLPGISLPRYGEGDWDDSLQPADPLLRERMVSSWTAALLYQTLTQYSIALARFDEPERAAEVRSTAKDVAGDFQKLLIAGDVVAGFGLFDGNPARLSEFLLHPSDSRTGLRYRLIPMTRGILSGIFSPQQAARHLSLINEHLRFPDGARLMDRPTTYAGGIEQTFRRSESAAFFGREVGLQYVHAHLRYAEALAVMGQAQELWQALLTVNPIAVTEVVPNARMRQRNCYFSSSDAAFMDRYEASRDYEKLRTAKVPVDGGWRVYSSGPGIYTSVVMRSLLGLRRHFGWVEFDPVLPPELDGCTCQTRYLGRSVRYRFIVKSRHFSPQRILANGVEMPAIRVEHPYRQGGLRVKQTDFLTALRGVENEVQIEL